MHTVYRRRLSRLGESFAGTLDSARRKVGIWMDDGPLWNLEDHVALAKVRFELTGPPLPCHRLERRFQFVQAGRLLWQLLPLGNCAHHTLPVSSRHLSNVASITDGICP